MKRFLTVSIVIIAGGSLAYFSILTAAATLFANSVFASSRTSITYDSNESNTFHVSMTTETRRNEVILGQPTLLEARVYGKKPITGMDMEAWAKSPSGNRVPLHFRDDGKDIDGLADDGVYSAHFIPGEIGTYQVFLKVNNADLKARYTMVGAFIQPTFDGKHTEGRLLDAVGKDFNQRAKMKLVVVQAPDDADGDGVPNWVEDAVTNPDGRGRGDGNGDGISDRNQANVVSVPVFGHDPTKDDAIYATLETSEAIRIVGIQLLPPPDNGPENVDFPFGGFRFNIEGLAKGGSVTVGIFLPRDYSINSFWKQTTNGDWSNLVEQVTMVGNRQRIQFTVSDGSAFDDDEVRNSIIVNTTAYPGNTQ